MSDLNLEFILLLICIPSSNPYHTHTHTRIVVLDKRFMCCCCCLKTLLFPTRRKILFLQ